MLIVQLTPDLYRLDTWNPAQPRPKRARSLGEVRPSRGIMGRLVHAQASVIHSRFLDVGRDTTQPGPGDLLSLSRPFCEWGGAECRLEAESVLGKRIPTKEKPRPHSAP